MMLEIGKQASGALESSASSFHMQGVMKALNVNKLTKCGVTFKFW